VSGGVLAVFETVAGLRAALGPVRAAKLGNVETYTPKPLEEGPSVVPLVVLVTGLGGAVLMFWLQTLGSVFAYPIDVGGRPYFSWPAFVPITFEVGALSAIIGGFVAWLFAARLPRLYDRVDECPAMRRAMRDLWCLAIQTDEPERARALLRGLSPARVEEIPE
jgi:hypothetical protein